MSEMHVIFGTGPLGKATMRALAAQGKRVRMVNRRGRAEGLPAGVEIVGGDALSTVDLPRLVEGAAVIYQCAQPAYQQWVEKFPGLQAAILEGAASAGARLVIGDNLYMYGEVDGPIHEGLPYAARTRKGRLRARMAEAALEAHHSGRVRVAIGRGSDFFGPEVLGSAMGERAILPALTGKTASLVGKLDLPHTYTYIEDFGKALAILGERDEGLGQAWHVPSPETITQRQFMELVFEEIGCPARMSGMGRILMAVGGLFIPEARESLEMMYAFERPYYVDSSKFERTFGLRATPQQEAIRGTVAWYRSHLKSLP